MKNSVENKIAAAKTKQKRHGKTKIAAAKQKKPR